MNSAPVRSMLGKALGIDSKRALPPYVSQCLSKWFAQRPAQASATEQNHVVNRRVVLFNDTYAEHYLPQVGRAAIEVLEAASYQVELATLDDSQRSAISQGLLDQAKRDGTLLFQRLDAVLIDDTPLLVCKPNCATTLSDDLSDLLDDAELAQRVASRV